MKRPSTFIVRLAGALKGELRGKVHHVRTGEDAPFSSVRELVRFFEDRTAIDGCGEQVPPQAPDAEDRSGITAQRSRGGRRRKPS
jgi:hypothetical protein